MKKKEIIDAQLAIINHQKIVMELLNEDNIANREKLKAIKEAGENVSKELNERKFTEKSLTSFGEYLLSAERTKHFTDIYNEEDNISLEERLSNVYHSDMVNWYDKQTRK